MSDPTQYTVRGFTSSSVTSSLHTRTPVGSFCAVPLPCYQGVPKRHGQNTTAHGMKPSCLLAAIVTLITSWVSWNPLAHPSVYYHWELKGCGGIIRIGSLTLLDQKHLLGLWVTFPSSWEGGGQNVGGKTFKSSPFLVPISWIDQQ